MKSTILVVIVAIIVIIIAASAFIYTGMQPKTGTVSNDTMVTPPPQTASDTYAVNFAYEQTTIPAGQNQWINVTIDGPGSYPQADLQGFLNVNLPNGTLYQTFSFTTDSNGQAEFPFTIAQNATPGTYNVSLVIEELGEITENVTSSFVVTN